MATTKISASGVVFPDATVQASATLPPGPPGPTGPSPPGPTGPTGAAGFPVNDCPPPVK
jgi:hypothetical protein